MRHLGGILGGARLLEIANSRAAATDSEGHMPSILGSFLMAGRFEGIVGRWSVCERWPRAQVLVCEASISKVPRETNEKPSRRSTCASQRVAVPAPGYNILYTWDMYCTVIVFLCLQSFQIFQVQVNRRMCFIDA